MHALSIKQPWLDLILFAGKTVENRSWKIGDKYLGQYILLCSSQKFDNDYQLVDMVNIDITDPKYASIIEASKERLGLALGTVIFTGNNILDNPWACIGTKFAHEIINASPLVNPFPVKGKLMIFEVPFNV